MTDPEPVICGFLEIRVTGTWKCIQAPEHEGGHYLVRLVQTAQEAS